MSKQTRQQNAKSAKNKVIKNIKIAVKFTWEK